MMPMHEDKPPLELVAIGLAAVVLVITAIGVGSLLGGLVWAGW